LFFTRSVFWMYVVGLFLGLFCCLFGSCDRWW
jgi:hypothetical protein